MPKTVVVRYCTKPDRGDENQRLVEKVFADLAEHQPDGLRYASFRLNDGVSFVHVAEVDTADGSSPLNDSAAFAAFQREIGDRCDEQPVVEEATVVGLFRLLAE